MDTHLKITIIAAITDNNVIGQDGQIPWHLPDDLINFHNLTRHKIIVMGRKTFESILKTVGHPLLDRTNVIVTRSPQYTYQNCIVVHSWDDVLEIGRTQGELFIIGGGEIYHAALPLADQLCLTNVHTTLTGDCFFPMLEPLEWELISKIQHVSDAKHKFPFTINESRRKRTVYLPNARVEDQKQTMRRILADNVCPFCPEYFARYHSSPILRSGQHWIVTPNHWAYPNTRVHLLMIPKKHVEYPNQLSKQALAEFWELACEFQTQHGIIGGGIGMRFGDPRFNGGTIYHLHAHILTGKFYDRTNADYVKLKMRFG